MVHLDIPYEDKEYQTIAPADPTVDAQVIAAGRLIVPNGLAKLKHIGSGSTSDPEYAWELDSDDNLTRLKEPGGGAGATNLAVANLTTTTLDVTSDTGTDATLPQAVSGTTAGLLSAADKALVDTISTKIDSADLSVGNKTGTTLEVANTGGDNVILPQVTATEAGLMSAADKVALDGYSGITNLSVGTVTATTLEILSSSGLDVVVPAANATDAGMLTAAGFNKIAEVDSKIEDCNLALGTVGASTIQITSDQGTDVTIPAVVAGATAGLMTEAQATLLASLPTAANLTLGTVTTTTVDIDIDIGTDVTIPAAVAGVSAGLMTSADKTKLDSSITSYTNLTTGAISDATGNRSVGFGGFSLDYTGLSAFAIDSSFEATSVLYASSGFAITMTAPALAASYTITLPAAPPTAQQVTDSENFMTLAADGTIGFGGTPSSTYITQGTMLAAEENRQVDLGGFDLDFVNVNDCTFDSPVTANTFISTAFLLERSSNFISLTTSAAHAVSYAMTLPLTLPSAGETASGENYLRIDDGGTWYFGSGGGGGGGGSDIHSEVADIAARDALSPSITGFTAFVAENQTTYLWDGVAWEMVGARTFGTATERAVLTNVEDNFVFDDVTDGRTYYYDSSKTPAWVEF